MIDNVSQLFKKTKQLVKSLQNEKLKSKTEKRRLHMLEKKINQQHNNSNTRTTVDISTSSVARSTITIIGLITLAYFLLTIKATLVLFFIAAFLSIALNPFVDKLQQYKIPRGIGILLIYVVFIGVAGVVISSFVPILATEIPKLANSVLTWISDFGIDTSSIQAQVSELQKYLTGVQNSLNRESLAAGLDVLSAISQNAITIVKSIAGGVFNFVMILVITFFMTISDDGIKRFMLTLFPRRLHLYIIEKSSAVEEKFGAWVRGQLILMLTIGTVTFIALKIAGVNYAATLATLAGLTELLPYVGPIAAFIPAFILAASQGGFVLALVVAAIYIGIQQLEGNIVVPLVMKKAVGLSPVAVMFAMLVGTSFPDIINPIVGIIISVPIAATISIFVHDYAEKNK